MAELQITEFTDPACPFAWSAEPQRRRLEWLYGDQLGWDVRMVGLSSKADQNSGFTPEKLSSALRSLAEPPRSSTSASTGCGRCRPGPRPTLAGGRATAPS
jgi:hypothetical protein